MKILSKEFNDYYYLPNTAGYRLGNKPPSLYLEDVPQNAVSLALVVYDSTVIYGEKELTYWMVWNLPVTIGEFTNENLPPEAVQGTNDMGTVGYFGPLLARGVNHVHFVVFALSSQLTLDSTAKRNDFDEAVNGNFIDHADITGMFLLE